MAGEVIFILYSYLFGLYTVLLTSVQTEHNHMCHQNDIVCLFIAFISTCLKYVHYGPKSKAIILHDWCDVLGIYFASSCMRQFSTYFEDGRMLESTTPKIPLIKSSHKCTQILFIILNSKIGIWICSQTRIDLNSQSNFYDVLTLDHTRPCPNQ